MSEPITCYACPFCGESVTGRTSHENVSECVTVLRQILSEARDVVRRFNDGSHNERIMWRLEDDMEEARQVAREMFPTYLNRLPGKAEALLAKYSWLGEAESR